MTYQGPLPHLLISTALLSVSTPLGEAGPRVPGGPIQDWRVEEVLQIGASLGDPRYQFGEIGGIAVDREGRTYVLDTMAGEVRVYSPSGEWLRTFGRLGEGPGELSRQASGVFVWNGSVVVPDLVRRRITVFDAAEGTPRVRALGFGSVATLRARMDDRGRLILQLRSVEDPAAPDAIVVIAGAGGAPDTVALLPRGEALTYEASLPTFNVFGSEPVWTVGARCELVPGQTGDCAITVRHHSATELESQIAAKLAASTRYRRFRADRARIVGPIRRLYARIGDQLTFSPSRVRVRVG